MYPDYTACAGPIKVELTYIGEGYGGDYDPTDPDDAPLYRVDVTRYRKQNAEDDGYGTNCTLIAAVGATPAEYRTVVRRLAQYANRKFVSGNSLSSIAAGISWMGLNDLTDQFGDTA